MYTSNRWKCFLLASIFIADSSGLPQMKPYEFAYKVNDRLLGIDFGHSESSAGQVVRGQYHVLLPDGQRQTVTYTADKSNGYQANVVAYTPTNIASDSTQQGVNHHLDFIFQENESKFMNVEKLRNIAEELTDDQDTEKSRLFFGPKPTLPTPQPIEPTPHPTEPTTSEVKCGIEKRRSSRRIAEGTEQYSSWHVGLKGNDTKEDISVKHNITNTDIINEDMYVCGGSIITAKHILTAAQCVCKKRPDELYVGIGDYDQTVTTDNLPDFAEPIRAKRIIVHEKYVCDGNPNPYDIAIVELSRPIDLVKYADDISPICLPKDDSKTYTRLNATVTGWGYSFGFCTDISYFSVPNNIEATQVRVLKNSRCSKILDLSDHMICATSMKGFNTQDNTYFCDIGALQCPGPVSLYGHSGGPLFVREGGQNVQIGLDSSPADCTKDGKPIVYTKVSKFLNWIKAQVSPEEIYTQP